MSRERVLSWINALIEIIKLQVNKDQIQLEKERKDYLIEQQRQQAMKEEQQLIAKQEAYEKAASLPVVMDTTPRPMPPEVSESLTTLVEGDEEQKNNTTEANSGKNFSFSIHLQISNSSWSFICIHQRGKTNSIFFDQVLLIIDKNWLLQK